MMAMIEAEEGWEYSTPEWAPRYIKALEQSLTYVALVNNKRCAFVRSINDGGFYIYVCDLLVAPAFRGQGLGKKLMEQLCLDHPGYEVFVMSDEDGYYQKIKYQRVGSIFRVNNRGQ